MKTTPQTARQSPPGPMDDPQASAQMPSTAAAWAVRLLMVLALLCSLPHLAGCGGGSDDDGAVATPRVDCASHPELCK